MSNAHDANETAAAVTAARNVLHAHMAALNSRDQVALAATLHFPHYRLTGGKLKVWDTPDSYFTDFLARAGDGWDHSAWNFLTPVAAGPDKVHLDVAFSRYRADGTALGTYRSLWVIAKIDNRWAAQLRSSFAA